MGSIGVLTNSTMVCAPLMSQSVEQMVSDMYRAKAQGADVVEIRLDCVKDFKPPRDVEFILENKPLPVVIVYRYNANSNPIIFAFSILVSALNL